MQDTRCLELSTFYPPRRSSPRCPAAAQSPLRTLAKPDAEYAEPFTQINGVRELKDGRVIVSDVREKTVQLVDLKAGSAQKIGREGSGPGEYAMPMRPSRAARRHLGRVRPAQPSLPGHRARRQGRPVRTVRD
jgi:hypothetical protein